MSGRGGSADPRHLPVQINGRGWEFIDELPATATDAQGNDGSVTTRLSCHRNPPRSLSDEFNTPPGATIVRFEDNFSPWPRYQNVRLWCFAYRVEPPAPTQAYVRSIEDNSAERLFVVTLQIVQDTRSAVWATADRIPGEVPRWSFHGVQPATDKTGDYAHILRATKLAGGMAISTRGKRAHDGATWPGGAPDFLEDLWTTLEGLQRCTGKIYGHDIMSRSFLQAMRGKPSARLLYKFLQLARIRRADVKGCRVSRSNYVQFIAEQGR